MAVPLQSGGVDRKRSLPGKQCWQACKCRIAMLTDKWTTPASLLPAQRESNVCSTVCPTGCWNGCQRRKRCASLWQSNDMREACYMLLAVSNHQDAAIHPFFEKSKKNSKSQFDGICNIWGLEDMTLRISKLSFSSSCSIETHRQQHQYISYWSNSQS